MSVASSHHSHNTAGTDVSSALGGGGGVAAPHGPRQRLGSVGESVPASDSSEGTASETFEHAPHWALSRMDDHQLQQQQQQQHHQQQLLQQQQHQQQQHINLRHSQYSQQHQQQQRQSTYRLSGASSHLAHSSSAGGSSRHEHGHDEVDDAAVSVSVVNGGGVGGDDGDDEDVGCTSEAGLDSLSLENSGVLSELERGQVESFFSGLGTEIFVCPSLANLYENCGQNDWRLVYTGVPVLLHDKGSTRSRSLPRVTLVLAERGTCFALWQDTIDQLSEYKIGGPAFHTMCLSGDHTKLIGFSYDSNQAAHDTWHTVQKLIADPANSAPGGTPGRKHRTAKPAKRPKPAPLPPKSQISAPCQFQHVTSVTADDAPRYFSLQAFVSGVVTSAMHRSH